MSVTHSDGKPRSSRVEFASKFDSTKAFDKMAAKTRRLHSSSSDRPKIGARTRTLTKTNHSGNNLVNPPAQSAPYPKPKVKFSEVPSPQTSLPHRAGQFDQLLGARQRVYSVGQPRKDDFVPTRFDRLSEREPDQPTQSFEAEIESDCDMDGHAQVRRSNEMHKYSATPRLNSRFEAADDKENTPLNKRKWSASPDEPKRKKAKAQCKPELHGDPHNTTGWHSGRGTAPRPTQRKREHYTGDVSVDRTQLQEPLKELGDKGADQEIKEHRDNIEKAKASFKGSESKIGITCPAPRMKAPSESSTAISDVENSSPRCQRCIRKRKGCDRKRPCQRCKDAGLGPEQCVPVRDRIQTASPAPKEVQWPIKLQQGTKPFSMGALAAKIERIHAMGQTSQQTFQQQLRIMDEARDWTTHRLRASTQGNECGGGSNGQDYRKDNKVADGGGHDEI